MNECPKCRKSYSDSQNYCLEDGTQLYEDLPTIIKEIPILTNEIGKENSFSRLFSEIENLSNKFDRIRVLANTTDLLLPAFETSKIFINKCEIILKRPNKNDIQFFTILEAIQKQWQHLEKKGRISKLTTHYSDSILLDWQVIFDDRCMILGLNTFDNDTWTKYEVISTFLILDSTEFSKNLIQKYIERFDKVFNHLSQL